MQILTARSWSNLSSRLLARSLRANSSRGFTLIEIMIVMAILAAVIAIGVPKLFDTKTKMRNAVRSFGVLPRQVHNAARLYNATMRLVISMPEGKEHGYWVESSPGNVVLLTEEQEKELERLTELQREGEKKKKAGFTADPRVVKKPLSLPKGLFFEEVEFGNRSTAITSGTAYVHFFPQGLVEEALIHIGDKKSLHWTVRVNPITGKVDVFERKVTLKDIRGQQ